MSKLVGKCPNCGNDIIVNDENKADVCPNCNKAYVTFEAINETSNVTNNIPNKTKDNTSKTISGIIIVIIVITLIFLGLMIVDKTSDNDGNIFNNITERELKKNRF